MDRLGSSEEGMQTGQEPNVIREATPELWDLCKDFEEAIKFIFC